jgi:hypothetical protein
VQQPFLADFTDLSRRLTPATEPLPRALTRLSNALEVGTPVVRSSVTLSQQTGKVFVSLEDLTRAPSTLLALKDARDSISVINPFANYVGPYQSVCNTAVYFWTGLSGDVAFQTANGSAQAALLKTDTLLQQDNKLGDLQDRPADIPANVDPRGATYPVGPPQPWEKQMTQPYGPAIDAQGNADCQTGQQGYQAGPFNGSPNRGDYDPSYKPANADPNNPSAIQDFDRNHAGGSRNVNANNNPGLSGPTFTGVDSLRDVP